MDKIIPWIPFFHPRFKLNNFFFLEKGKPLRRLGKRKFFNFFFLSIPLPSRHFKNLPIFSSSFSFLPSLIYDDNNNNNIDVTRGSRQKKRVLNAKILDDDNQTNE